MTNAYARAGVDVHAGYQVVERIKAHVARTEVAGVMGGIGGFGGCFDLSGLGLREPVLVSGTDGVGTKLMVAQAMNTHDTIGIDCVAMCVNDIVAQGAKPLYFLDYIATGKTDPLRVEQIVAGVAAGCVESGCALIGGETAEMPGMYAPDEYDIAGFAVGAVEKSQLITGADICAGDLLVGLPSSGVHSNGFSLVREVFTDLDEVVVEVVDAPIGQALLAPTRIYTKPVLELASQGLVKGAAHITGGGFVENIPRMLPGGLGARVELGSWPVGAVFQALQERGKIEPLEMYEIFNMGIGMVLAIEPKDLGAVIRKLAHLDEPAFVIGSVVEGEQRVELVEQA